MNTLDTRFNALSNNIAGTSEKKKEYTEYETEKDFLDAKSDDGKYDKVEIRNRTVTETETLSLVPDFGKDAKENGNMEAPKGTGNTIMNDTPDVVSRYENKIDDEIIEVMTKTSSLENWKEESISQGIFPYPLIYIWNCICNGSTQALDSSDFQSQTPPQDLKKDMESSVSLIGLEIIWVFKGGGIGTWWIGTHL